MIWTGIVIGEGYSCVLEEMRDPDENRKKRVFTVEALECFIVFVHHKIWVDDHSYEYIAVAMYRNDRKMGQKPLPIFRVYRKIEVVQSSSEYVLQCCRSRRPPWSRALFTELAVLIK